MNARSLASQVVEQGMQGLIPWGYRGIDLSAPLDLGGARPLPLRAPLADWQEALCLGAALGAWQAHPNPRGQAPALRALRVGSWSANRPLACWPGIVGVFLAQARRGNLPPLQAWSGKPAQVWSRAVAFACAHQLEQRAKADEALGGGGAAGIYASRWLEEGLNLKQAQAAASSLVGDWLQANPKPQSRALRATWREELAYVKVGAKEALRLFRRHELWRRNQERVSSTLRWTEGGRVYKGGAGASPDKLEPGSLAWEGAARAASRAIGMGEAFSARPAPKPEGRVAPGWASRMIPAGDTANPGPKGLEVVKKASKATNLRTLGQRAAGDRALKGLLLAQIALQEERLP